jgi:general secretion pathway protein G
VATEGGEMGRYVEHKWRPWAFWACVLVVVFGVPFLLRPRFSGPPRHAREAAARTEIAALETALEMFKIDVGRFPTTGEGLAALWKMPEGAANWKGPYFTRAVSNDPWGHPYVYRVPGTDGRPFDLFSYGPDGVPSRDDIGLH